MNIKKVFGMCIMFLLVIGIVQALAISEVRVTDVTDTSAVVRWITDGDTDGVITFSDDSDNLDQVVVDTVRSISHSVALTQLTPNTQYFLKIQSSTDTETVEDNNAGNFYTFTTQAIDDTPPGIVLDLAEVVNNRRVHVRGETEVGTDLNLFVNDVLIRSHVSANGEINFPNVVLRANEDNTIRIDAVDVSGNQNTATFNVFVDTSRPIITLEPTARVSTEAVILRGTVSEIAQVVVIVNNETVFDEQVDTFEVSLDLDDGESVVEITATDEAGNSDRVDETFELDTQPPEIGEVTPLDDSPFYYEGRATDTVRGTTEPGADVYLFIEGTDGFSATSAFRGSGLAGSIGNQVFNSSTLDELVEDAQFKTTAEADGSFSFGRINFQHPSTTGVAAPQEVRPGLVGQVGTIQSAQLQQEERTVNVFIVVVDKVGLITSRQYAVDIGNCFSGSFDFNIKNLQSFQTPSVLSPNRLDSGTEIVSFVLQVNYSGRASNNRRDPNVQNQADDFFEINDVVLEPACRGSQFLDREPAYQFACQILQGRPALARPIDPQGTNWYFRYNLGASDRFTDFDEKFWEELLQSELKFPFKITVNYEEDLIGQQSTIKTQTICRDVVYAVDVPIDPRDVLPDFMLEEGQELIGDTIEVIDEVLPVLEDVIQYAGVGCMGGFGLRTIVQVYRRFIEKFEFAKCAVLNTAGSAVGTEAAKCPIDNVEELESCFYLAEEGTNPYGDDHKKAPEFCSTLDLEGAEPDNGRYDLEKTPQMMQHFSGTTSAWRTEATLYKVYRFLCDRVFCHAAPAGWTQDKELSEIQLQLFAQQQCGSDTSAARTLLPIDDCYEEMAERQNILDRSIVVDRGHLMKVQNKCYALGTAIYKVADDTEKEAICSSDVSAGGSATHLKRIDRQRTIVDLRGRTEAPNDICAIAVGDQFYTADTRTCTTDPGTDNTRICGKDVEAICAPSTDESVKGKYAAGPTVDCWEGKLGTAKGAQCFCGAPVEDHDRQKQVIEQRGATFAGKEKASESDVSEIGWEWNYREWQIFRNSNGRRGIYYPPERYYSGRDFSAAFGQDYLLDRVFGTKTPTVDPFTQHIGAVQSVCLSGIRARVLLLKNILTGMQNCLQQVQTTGRADAGVCKEIFSQFVCNLAYKAVNAFNNQCVADNGPAGRVGTQFEEIQEVFDLGGQAITETLDSTANELHDEYGNAQLDQYLEGGSQTLMKKICLAAFGIETGFDFDGFIDAAYSVPFATSVSVFSSEGAKGRREFLSFNPANLHSVYEYRAAWTIAPGCDLESYKIDLAAVTNSERQRFSSIDCSAVNNFEAGTNGCDNLNGQQEIIQPFFSDTRVEQGAFIDRNLATNVEAPNRFDHVKVTLFADSRQDGSKCFPEENLQGSDSAVFYFPIHDATAKDVLQCDVTPTSGTFLCSISQLSSFSQAFIENIECFDPDTNAFRNCREVILTLEDSDPVRIRTSIFSSGEDKVCLDRNVVTANAGSIPRSREGFIEIPGLGRPGSIPLEMNLLPAITDEIFNGNEEEGITNVEVTGTPFSCLFDTNPPAKNDPDPEKRLSARPNFVFVVKDTSGDKKYEVQLSDGIVPQTEGFTKVGKVLTKDEQKIFTAAELEDVVYLANGFGIRSVRPTLEVDRSSLNTFTCNFRTIPPRDTVPEEQTWNINLALFRPDSNNVCGTGSSPVPQTAELAFDTNKREAIKVRATSIDTPSAAAYKRGKALYATAIGGGTPERKIQLFDDAIAEFSRVIGSTTLDGSEEEMMSWWWTITASIQKFKLQNDAGDLTEAQKSKQEALGSIAGFERRAETSQVQGNVELQALPQFKMINAYIPLLKAELEN